MRLLNTVQTVWCADWIMSWLANVRNRWLQTQAMIISTQHLLPVPAQIGGADSSGHAAGPVASQGGTYARTVFQLHCHADGHFLGTPPIPQENGAKIEQQEISLPSTAPTTPPASTAVPLAGGDAGDVSMGDATLEIEEVSKTGECEPRGQTGKTQSGHPPGPPRAGLSSPGSGMGVNMGTAEYVRGLPIDVCFEAAKLPLDVAIFNSARACGGEEKIRKYLQAVLVVGGGALIPGMAHALESRWVDRLTVYVV